MSTPSRSTPAQRPAPAQGRACCACLMLGILKKQKTNILIQKNELIQLGILVCTGTVPYFYKDLVLYQYCSATV